METAPVRVRIAPSPTGDPHVGTAYIALFNYVFARKAGGQFILRIEDTDIARSTPEAVQAIIDGMQWLGLAHDEGPFYQLQRMYRYKEVIGQMLEAGTAYRCYMSKEELDALRAEQEARKEKPRYDGRWRPDRAAALGLKPPADAQPVLRFRNPDSGEVSWNDLVKGPITIANTELDDLVLLRADGVPTYNFGVVVDDLDMRMTHVIRGDDHVNNTPRQINILAALGATLPQYGHVPMIHGPDGEKLSKRHGAVSVMQYHEDGFLPDAVINYLARLGWSHGDDEIFSTEQAIQWFDIKDVNKSAARFDFKKLADLNGNYIRALPDADLLEAIRSFLPHTPDGAAQIAAFERVGWNKLAAALPGLKTRAKILPELVEGAAFLTAQRPLPMDDKAAKLLDGNGKAALTALLPALEAVTDWAAPPLEEAVRKVAEARGLKLGQAAQPLRAALTGKSVSPPVFDVMAVLGREEALGRLRDQAG